MKNIIIATLAVVFVIACDDPIESLGELRSGLWYFDEGEIFDDTCVYPDKPTNGSGLFRVENNGDGTFTIDTTDGTEPFLCTLSGEQFTCPKRAQADIPIPELNTTMKVHVSASGELSSPTRARGYQTATISCEGALCQTAADLLKITLPCSYSIRFSSFFQAR